MGKNFITLPLIFIVIFSLGCAKTTTKDAPSIVRQNFDSIDLSNYKTCKAVLLVEGAYDIGVGIFVAGDVAQGELALGDSTMLNGKAIFVKGLEGNGKRWDRVAKPHRIGVNFENQITKTDYKKDELICFNGE